MCLYIQYDTTVTVLNLTYIIIIIIIIIKNKGSGWMEENDGHFISSSTFLPISSTQK